MIYYHAHSVGMQPSTSTCLADLEFHAQHVSV